MALQPAQAAPLASGATYITDTDNENNAGTHTADYDMDTSMRLTSSKHPIEFRIYVNQAPTSNAQLSIYALDVDEERGEIDNVYWNGSYIGHLSGTNNTWNTTTLNVPIASVQQGWNMVQITVASGWVVTVDWGQLLVDGGSADMADVTSLEITDFTVGSSSVTVQSQAVIEAAEAGTFRLETTLLDPSGNAIDANSVTQFVGAGQNATLTCNSSYSKGLATGTYKVVVALFDNNTQIQQTSVNVEFEHTANVGPTASNTAPTISGSPSNSAYEDQLYSFTPTAHDDDGDTLTFSVSNKPSWASFSTTTGRLYGTPSQAHVGTTNDIRITVSDPSNETDSLGPFSITVVNTNDAPQLSGTPATRVDEDAAYSFTPSLTDPDAGDTHTFSIQNRPAWATFSASTGALTGTPRNEHVGAYEDILISVEDAAGATDSLVAFSITVVNTNDAPVASADAATTGAEIAIVIDVLANDDDDDLHAMPRPEDTLTISQVDDPPHGEAQIVARGLGSGPVADRDASVIHYVSDGGFSGPDSFDYTVSDGQGGTDTATIHVTVQAGSISGWVFLDTDLDGIRDRDEQQGFQVYIKAESDWGMVKQCQACESGWYEFPTLPPGVWTITHQPVAGHSETSPGMVTVELDHEAHPLVSFGQQASAAATATPTQNPAWTPTPTWYPSPTVGPSATATVRPVVTAIPTPTWSPTPTFTPSPTFTPTPSPTPRPVVSGRVLDESGQPLSGMLVEAYWSYGSEWRSVATLETQSDGSYSWTPEQVGAYRLRYVDANLDHVETYYRSSRSFSGASDVIVTLVEPQRLEDVVMPDAVSPQTTVGGDASTLVDAATGQVDVSAWEGSSIVIEREMSCPDGSVPYEVNLYVAGRRFPMARTDHGSYAVTLHIPEDLADPGDHHMQVIVACANGGTSTGDVGELHVQLHDPAGQVTDAVTGEPIVGAKVQLYLVPGWDLKTGLDDNRPNTCQCAASRGDEPWSQPAPVWAGVLANPQLAAFNDLATISPAMNPQVTGASGRYSWDVSRGCWYVVVSAEGYVSKASMVVGVPPAVTDLDVALDRPMVRIPLLFKP